MGSTCIGKHSGLTTTLTDQNVGQMTGRLTLTILISFILTILISCENREKIGIDVIKKIEDYRLEKNKLPESLTDIGIEEKEEGPISYRKDSETEYIVWYGLTLGESRIYDSKTKTWN